jgi:hypothetical protein
MPGNHAVIAIDQYWVRPAEFSDGSGDLSDLRVRMSAGIAGVRNEVFKGRYSTRKTRSLLTQTCADLRSSFELVDRFEDILALSVPS